MVLEARVENGRIRLDEPTDLPDGKEVSVVLLEDDGLTEADREKDEVSSEHKLVVAVWGAKRGSEPTLQARDPVYAETVDHGSTASTVPASLK